MPDFTHRISDSVAIRDQKFGTRHQAAAAVFIELEFLVQS